MKTKSLLLVATTIALGSCTTMKLGTPAPNFRCVAGGPCTVTVTITACPGTPSVDYPVIGLARGNGNVPIFWQFSANSAANVTFAQDGIAFKPPSTQFTTGMPIANGTKYTWIGVNSAPDTSYQYGVRVMQGSTQCGYLDPTVVNE